MGSYLSEPVTEKESTDESNDRVNCGVSSMQGWRLSQEDAHNCILNYDEKSSFFAVYDGHGGQEVAQYCSDKLPQFIKNTTAYKEGDIEKALIDGFLGFDATIATPEVVSILKELASDKEADEGDEDDEENVNNLYEEATMPIEQVIEKYTSNLVNPNVKNLKKDERFSKSPCLKAKTDSDEGTVGTSASSSSEAAAGSSSSSSCSSSSNSGGSCSSNSICNDGVSSSSSDSNEAKVNECKLKKDDIGGGGDATTSNGSSMPEIKISSADSSDTKEATPAIPPSPISSGGGGGDCDVGNKKHEPTQNGEVSTPTDSEAQAKNDVSSSVIENGETPISKKGKGKAKMEIKTPKIRPKRNAQQLYKQWLDDDVDSDESDEEDQTFEEPNDDSSDDENDESVDVSVDADGDDEVSDDETTEDEDAENDDDDMEDEDEDSQGYAFVRNMKEEPGSNSGCTAVVAILRGNELFVANAGDSRCIVCRKGEAVEMSIDHKPEDKPEMERVIKAGGEVTCDGRVNGGLNLSRAIGDHAYKQNQELSDREQMIIALPDIRKLTISPEEDEFMVLACDGIWNFMSSQQVVDFVRPRINEQNMQLSKICEEMFDHCLAPCTLGDGTGCDNMTAIIVKFNKTNILKRSASTDLEEDVKRIKTDESESHIDTTV